MANDPMTQAICRSATQGDGPLWYLSIAFFKIGELVISIRHRSLRHRSLNIDRFIGIKRQSSGTDFIIFILEIQLYLFDVLVLFHGIPNRN